MVSSSIKSVTFSQDIQKIHAVHELSWTKHDIQAAWYSAKEMTAIQQESREIMNLAARDEADTRGLECISFEGSRKCQEIVRWILTEQGRLKRDGGNSSASHQNVMALAEISLKASAHRQRIAYLWGLKDAEVARAYYYTGEELSWNTTGGRLPTVKSKSSSTCSLDSLASSESSLDGSQHSRVERRESRRARRRQRIQVHSAASRTGGACQA
jgi:hypothetical protein